MSTLEATSLIPPGLAPSDDLLHPIRDDIPGWSENYLSQAWMPATGVGFWLHHGRTAFDARLWNEMLVAYLPDDEYLVARGFGYGDSAAGPAGPALTYECLEPFRRWRKTYRGAARRVSGADLRERPLADGAHVGVDLELIYEAVTPAFYLGPMDGQNWAASHYEQHCRVTGQLRYDGREIELDGSGLRDHSWGARDLTSLEKHIWTHGQLPSGRAFCLMHIANDDGTGRMSHAAFHEPDGSMRLGTLTSGPALMVDEDDIEAGFVLRFDVAGAEVVIEADVLQVATLSLVGPAELVIGADRSGPLCHHLLYEAAIRFTCGDEVGYGLAERTLKNC